MVFSSLTFLFLFLPPVLLGYSVLPPGWRNAWLLLASLIFYGLTEPNHLSTLIGLVVSCWWIGGRIERALDRKQRQRWLSLGVAVVVAPWLVLSLYRPVVEQAVAWGWLPVLPGLLPVLPVGLSFVTFHALSYLGDVYVRRAPAEPRLDQLALYVTIFPQLLLGPILRWYQARPQLGRRIGQPEDVIWGVSRFVIGLAKKALLADPLGQWVDRLLALPPDQVSIGLAWMACTGYVLRLYLDYSSYADMALGMLRLFGFHFPENFRYPLAATSIGQFFQRWNISVFSFFRDYVYRPLRGREPSAQSRGLALLAVWLVSAFWHGVGLKYFIAALLLVLLMILERMGWARILVRWPVLGRIYTLTALTVTLVFFHSPDLQSAAAWLTALCGAWPGDTRYVELSFLDLPTLLLLPLAFLVSQPLGVRLYPSVRHRMLQTGWTGVGWWIGWLLTMGVMLVAVVAQLLAVRYSPFLYFQF